MGKYMIGENGPERFVPEVRLIHPPFLVRFIWNGGVMMIGFVMGLAFARALGI